MLYSIKYIVCAMHYILYNIHIYIHVYMLNLIYKIWKALEHYMCIWDYYF